MQFRTVVSLVVGALAPMTLAGSAFFANPLETEAYDPQTDAWLWRADAKAFARVPLGQAILDPQTTHAADGSVLVSARSGGPTVRFDLSTQRFVPYPEAPPAVPKPPDAHRHAVPLEGNTGLWVEQGDPTDQLLAFPSFSTTATFASSRPVSAGFAVDDGRIAVLVGASGELGLFAGQPQAAKLEPVALRGATNPIQGSNVASTGLENGRLLIALTSVYEAKVTTRVLDLASGELSEGPRFPSPRGATEHWYLNGTWVPGGGALLVGNGQHSLLRNPGWNALGGLLLLGQFVGLGFSLWRKKLSLLPLGLGLAAGLVPLAGVVLLVLSTVHR